MYYSICVAKFYYKHESLEDYGEVKNFPELEKKNYYMVQIFDNIIF